MFQSDMHTEIFKAVTCRKSAVPLGVRHSQSNWKQYKTFNGPVLTMFPWISSHNWCKLIIPVFSKKNLNSKKKLGSIESGLDLKEQKKNFNMLGKKFNF